MKIYNPNIVRHNKVCTEQWKEQADNADSKLFVGFGVNQQLKLQMYVFGNIDKHVLIGQLENILSQLKNM